MVKIFCLSKIYLFSVLLEKLKQKNLKIFIQIKIMNPKPDLVTQAFNQKAEIRRIVVWPAQAKS
jgi:hypothetical protein